MYVCVCVCVCLSVCLCLCVYVSLCVSVCVYVLGLAILKYCITIIANKDIAIIADILLERERFRVLK